ncbi:filamentous hemagglutinin N-terminal domain-containing protein [Tychonema sp. LEGE 07203]|uniref:two-partner secretion domain-containing protein n=1 Tax=Tychonema sp. LEGE 07203 TaxID=1828671 RepID=UPI0019F3E1BA|nr:filamentous hemagglutinin N-terminal domain-containing protein [Tychonema sp. LEGE 07203]MBE9095267.1 filamentous hemagglutinin N-terminal domain-containing protein [Tychonema sp. LEGE 07203]
MPYALCPREHLMLLRLGYMSRLSYCLLFAFLLLFPSKTFAQIIPDGTLGAESSRAVPDTINNLPSDRITGGATRGVNLFHSFGEFNIKEGRGAYFANPSGIANIFTRVTGGNSSNILGTLGVSGNANLFLINPKGIVFGPNARLDLRGSFLASSAAGVVFNNGFEFSAANPNAVPLLAINIPVGLSFRDNPGAIVNASRVTQKIEGTEIPVGLAVAPGQTLAMVGGDLIFNNGFASAFSGNIQLGSVASPGLVSFNITPIGLGLDYTNIAKFGNIELSGLSAVTASGPAGGSIALRGSNVILRDRASLVSDTLGSINGRDITVDAAQLRILDQAFISTGTTGTGAGGNVSVRATDAVEITGIGFDNFRRNVLEAGTTGTASFLSRQSGIAVGTVGAGAAGNITVDTKQLMLREGALIINPSYGAGAGGNVAIKASESVEVSESGLFTSALDRGRGGNLTVDTAKLTVRNGSVLSSATVGAGNGGNLIVRASDSVLLTEYRLDSSFGTGIITNSIGGTGNAGNIEINTRSLLIEGGTSISSTSGVTSRNGVIPAVGRGGNITINAADSVTLTGSRQSDSLSAARIARSQLITGTVAGGSSGDLRINTRRLTLEGAAAIGASTLGAGNGGNIIVNASESVKLIGTTDNLSASGIATASGDTLFQTLFRLAPPTGAAGNISITTPSLTLGDGATIAVGSLGSGRSGNINVVANSIALDNKASIDGTTVSGVGANINLQARNIQLRRGSRITTDAGTSEGGNININSDTLAALPKENSDITANARSAGGGRVKINVPNVFGFSAVSREQVRGNLELTDAQFADLPVTPTSLLGSSDIAAISQSGGPALQGTVTFSSSGVNPAQGLVELPQNLVDRAALIAANPCIEGGENEFTVTGKGGVPPSPNDALSSESTPFPWVEGSATSNVRDNRDVTDTGSREKREVVAAGGWVVNEKGEVTLVGTVAAGDFPQRTPHPLSVCQPR